MSIPPFLLLTAILASAEVVAFSHSPPRVLFPAAHLRCTPLSSRWRTGSTRPSLTSVARRAVQQDDADERDATLGDAQAPPLPPSPTSRPPSPERAPTANELMTALGTTPRRIFLSLTGSSAIALAANFLGVTSNLLSSVPADLVESSGLDTYYPVDGFKRYNSGGEYGYTLVIPQEWVADTAVELAKATRRAGTLDYGMRRGGSGAPGAGVLPDAAFGPPGKKDARGLTPQGADTNVSVVASRLRPGFTLSSLGPPREAAKTLLRVSLAPEGSGRTATLLTASEVRRGQSDMYQFEYDVDRGERGVPLRAISVIGARGGDTLITSTVVAPQTDWADSRYDAKLRRVAESFKLTQ